MSSKRIKETIRKSNFFQIQKERIRTIEECIIQLEYLNDDKKSKEPLPKWAKFAIKERLKELKSSHNEVKGK